MKFKFCGDLDSPDWLLNGISILSDLTSVKLKLVAVQIMKDIVGLSKFDYEKALSRTSRLESLDEQKSAITSLTYIMTNAARFDIDHEILSTELQQLGLPKDSTIPMCRSYKEYKELLIEKFKTKTLRLSKLDSIEWKVDYLICSSQVNEVNEPSIQLSLTTNSQVNNLEVSLSKFRVLYQELLNARKQMEM